MDPARVMAGAFVVAWTAFWAYVGVTHNQRTPAHPGATREGQDGE